MCDDASGHPDGGDRAVSRRALLQGMVALATLAGCRSATPGAGPARTSRALGAQGRRAYRLGMHLHASASEGAASVRSQLTQAAANGFDVAWFTEHDWRRRRLLFRPTYSFLPGETAMGGEWNLARVDDVGSVTGDSGGEQVLDPTSPNDPATRKGSLRLRATSTGGGLGAVAYRVDATSKSRMNYQGRIAGRTVSVDVLPAGSGPDAWAEVEFQLSHHPGAGSRPEGVCTLRYRLRPDIAAGTVRSQGLTGIVDVPVRVGTWQTQTFDLTADARRAWPDIDPRDNGLTDIRFRAASRNRAPAVVVFGYLRLEEQPGYDALGVEQELLAAYAADVPDVVGLIGTEISLGAHLNQYGGRQAPYDYGPVAGLRDLIGDNRRSIVDFVHAQGGLASINHPFKPGDAARPTSAQAVALDLLAVRAGGADLLEVGYAKKGGAGLADHLAVWDTLSRNGLFLTGNGASDDHSGQGWADQKNRFYTAAWSGRLDETGLLASLASGRAFVGYLGAFAGTIDMAVDDVPMGAVSVSALTSRQLRIDVGGLPSGGAVQLVRGSVDYAGKADPNPGTAVQRTLGPRDLGSGRTVPVDTTDDCFYRLQVVDGSGTVVGFGQPIWILKSPPPEGIPASRRTSA